ncbi:gamma-glutamyl-gamma-aminobutyrate hydrolase family protein [Natronospirillum operosum]|uniref:Gamma-glutamyl-gamma-aminobutyrate hydrolase family protein n=2 Tax=Natronospirillum operosum TaxID=2759953 RepID=A0A4Z0W218_9GAMM|nr:gamma-glutamyl-gamma-aminobutyrate hydrolase family protein [Natronospirillum operosum]
MGIWLAGGRPRQLRPGDDVTDWPWQGVVITGGHDVDPVLYAAEPEVNPRYDTERDAFESAMISQALAHGTPILGICRGAQLLNVALGGSLFQDLRARRRHTSHRRSLLPLKQIELSADSRLSQYLDTGLCRVNSLHNQAIDRLADALQVSARDQDDIIQAVEYRRPEHFVVGVQWHPEFLLYQLRQRQLFRALVCRARCQRLDAD